MTTRGGESVVEVEEIEWVKCVGEDFGGGGFVEEIGEQRHQAADDGRVGIGAEVTASGVEAAD